MLTLGNNESELLVIASRLQHENMVRGDGLDGFFVSRSRKHGHSIARDLGHGNEKPRERGRS